MGRQPPHRLLRIVEPNGKVKEQRDGGAEGPANREPAWVPHTPRADSGGPAKAGFRQSQICVAPGAVARAAKQTRGFKYRLSSEGHFG